MDKNALKQKAAEKAVELIQDGMVVGLGHGSTAHFAHLAIARRLREGTLKNIVAIPCSRQVEKEAHRLGIPLGSLDDHPEIDITIDGADEVDPHLNLIKGGGGALLREKIVAQASKQEVIIVDEGKLSPALGTHWALPVEVVPFGVAPVTRYVKSLGGNPQLRKLTDGNLFITDQGNYILDCQFGPITNPAELAQQLCDRAGVVEHGLFIGLATMVIVGKPDGVEILTPTSGLRK